MWCWRRTEKIQSPEKLINEVLEHIGEKRKLLNIILGGKVNWIGHILRRNWFI